YTQTVEWVDHCYTGSGTGYRGLQTLTASGHQCQTWASKTPHLHAYTPEGFPEAGLENNYCRNPDSDPNGPWCITQDPNVLWEYCALQRCASGPSPTGAEQRATLSRGEKNGLSVRSTNPAPNVPHYRRAIPHSRSYNPDNGPCLSLQTSYCYTQQQPPGLWCNSANNHFRRNSWEHCDIYCDSFIQTNPFARPNADTLPSTALFGQDCVFGSRGYRGAQAVTSGGKTCQAWASQSPHRHQFVPANYTDADLSLGYCRNPDGDLAGPWCYTTDSATRWQYCGIAHC
uniref:Kringle domain-containing protein n=1 Tax=Petromyzon marinus TaxID=7757 RepID=S4R938_PETMA